MTTILGILSFALFTALIVGLVKPALVLRWTKKPTRFKVFNYWFLSTIILIILIVASMGDEEKNKSNLESAKIYIEKGKYDDAISKLESIDKENPLYQEAQKLILKADSLNKLRTTLNTLAKEANTEKPIGEKTIEKESTVKDIVKDEKTIQIEELVRELKSVNEGILFSTYRGTIESLQLELVLFGTWSNIISEGEKSADSEIKNLAKQLRAKVASIQIKEFPILRKEYSNIVAKKMWENDIEVSANGTGNKYLNFTGGVFAANKNKQDFQNQVNEVLKMFRFNQSRYRWYKGEDEFTFYTIYKGKDSDVFTFDK